MTAEELIKALQELPPKLEVKIANHDKYGYNVPGKEVVLSRVEHGTPLFGPDYIYLFPKVVIK